MEHTLKGYFSKKNVHVVNLLVSIAVPLLVGGLSALLTRSAMAEFEALQKPPLSPPSWLFPVVWTVLFLLMGIGSYMVWASDSAFKGTALGLYGIQLFVNFFWSILFFNFSNYLLAFIWLVFLWLLILAMCYYFWRCEPVAAYLQIPYLLWVAFAGYLNLSIYFLNR